MSTLGAKYREWYGRNQKRIATKRNDLYRNDPEYRQRVLERQRSYRAGRSSGEEIQREYTREYRGKKIPVYGTGTVASKLGTYPTAIIGWEKRGWIPAPSFYGNHRLYTEWQIIEMGKLMESIKTKKASVIAVAVEALYDNWF